MATAKKQFLLNWDEFNTDNSPTQMEKDLEKVINEAMQKADKILLSDAEITNKAIKHVEQFKIKDKPITNEKMQGYAVRDFYAGYKAALNFNQ